MSPGWTHPDRLERVSRAPVSPGSADPAPPEEARSILTRALITGGLRRIPKHPRHRQVVLAMLCATLRRRYPYQEVELNDVLRERLAAMRAGVDHVTCRRYLVDLDFVKRDRGGLRYLLNFPKLEATLTEEARSGAEAIIHDALQRSRP